jgi:hypothetical protein
VSLSVAWIHAPIGIVWNLNLELEIQHTKRFGGRLGDEEDHYGMNGLDASCMTGRPISIGTAQKY